MNFMRQNCVRTLFRQFSGSNNNCTYKSAISLENIYPKSNLSLTTPTKVPADPKCPSFSGYVPVEKLDITYSRSTGPGGQNVNTVSTKVDLRFHVETADWISPEIKQNLLELLKTKITKEGFLVIRSDKTRYQQMNLADALERLRTYIREAAQPPKELSPETEEKLRKRREKNARLRLMEKRERSFTKQQRQAPNIDF